MSVYLLDKNHVRKAIAGIAKAEYGHLLTRDEVAALFQLRQLYREQSRVFISIELFNILSRISKPEVAVILESVEVLYGARYFKRWARRLQRYGFTREDSKILGLGTFGTDLFGDILGVNNILTFDKAFYNNFRARRAAIADALLKMTRELELPYSDAQLPDLGLL